MNKTIFNIILIFSSLSLLAQDRDTIVVYSVYELNRANQLNLTENKVVKLVTYDVNFKMFTRDLDTNNCNTICFFYNFSNFVKNDTTISNIEVGVHLSMKEWSNQYSYKLDKMWEQIISVLVNQNVKQSILTGKNYYDTKPIKSKPDIGETEKQFWDTEYLFNRRVEFIINFN